MAWTILCITYLYFKETVNANGLETVKKSQSLLQPYLAYWAIFWTSMMGITRVRTILTELLFQGFKAVMGWNHSFQNRVQWALQLTTYSPVIMFFLLLGISRWVLGEEALQRKDLDAVHVVNGMTDLKGPPWWEGKASHQRNSQQYIALCISCN